jgi:hypothetical protein
VGTTIMNRSILIAGLATAGLALASLGLQAADRPYGSTPKKSGSSGKLAHSTAPGRTTKTPAKTNDTYLVLKVNDDYKVIRAADLSTEKKRIQDEYAKEIKDYPENKKADPTLVRPKHPTVVAVSKKFKTQEDAQKYIDDIQSRAVDSGDGGDVEDLK